MKKLTTGYLLKITGGVTFFIGAAGGILGVYDYSLRFKGATLPEIDPVMGSVFAVIGAGLFYWGWKMEKDKAAKSEETNS